MKGIQRLKPSLWLFMEAIFEKGKKYGFRTKQAWVIIYAFLCTQALVYEMELIPSPINSIREGYK